MKGAHRYKSDPARHGRCVRCGNRRSDHRNCRECPVVAAQPFVFKVRDEMVSAKTRKHPDDVKMEREGVAKGRRMRRLFHRARFDQFSWLVGTYADAEAHKKLDQLREEFWGDPKWDKPRPRSR